MNVHDLIEIEPLSPGDDDRLLSFYAANLENYDRFHRQWKWRQGRDVYYGEEKAVLATMNNEIIGSVGIVPAVVTLNGSRYSAAWQQDSLVSSAARGKGVGKRLVQKGMEGWGITMAKGTSDAMYRLRKSIGFQDVSQSDYLLHVMHPGHQSLTSTRPLVEMLLWLWAKFIPWPTISEDILIRQIEEFDSSFDLLARKISEENAFRLYKDRRYLNWRYFECPGKDYAVLRAGAEQARGAAVLSMSGSNRESGWIVDLLCKTDDTACVCALIRKSMAYFRSVKAAKVWVFATHPTVRRCFQRFGFLPTGRSPRFTYFVSGAESSLSVAAQTHWNFWHGDGDIELYM
jgi:hypothetical protein